MSTEAPSQRGFTPETHHIDVIDARDRHGSARDLFFV